ncbi:MAG: hypothetical protein KGJ86_14610 [Chloroflexota bacterium]|nr:hypothetical protein [Chloroflexota bacterium]
MAVVLEAPRTRQRPLVDLLGAEDSSSLIVQRRMEIADQIGEEVDRVRVQAPDWGMLTQRVVVVSLSVGYYRGRLRLQAEDLGLQALQDRDPEFAQSIHQAVLLGSKRLLPDEIMRRVEVVESKARYALERNSLTSGFGHLVSREVYPELRTTFAELRDEFFTLRDELAARYEEVYAEMLGVYRRMGRGVLEAYKRDGRYFDESESVWVEQYAQRVMSHLPSAATIAASYSFEWQPAFLATAAEVAQDLALANLRQREAELEAARLRLEAQNIRYQEDFNYQKMRQELEAVRAAAKREEELAREVEEHAHRQHQEWIEGTFKEISCQLRELVYEDVVNVLNSMKSHGHLVRNSSKEIKSVIERLGRLNYLDDGDVNAVQRQLEAIIESNPKKRDPQAIAGVLREIATMTRADLVAAGRSPRSGAAVAIPDAVDPAQRALARQRVHAATPPLEVPAVRRRRGQDLTPALPL